MTAAEFGFLSAPTVLVVDDDPEMREFLRFCLETWANVIEAGGGEDGIRACRDGLPDLVLLDVNMPGLDGFDVINELKHDPATRHIPVMFITAETLPEVESECLEAGAADYVAKPINARVLVARARTHVLLKQQADRLSELAIVDGLTGAMTRTAFDARLVEEVDRSARSGHPLTLALVRFDDPDSYGNTYGPLAADDVVAGIADVTRRVARRRSDLVCRFGPTELAVLLPDLTADAAVPVLARIGTLVEALAIPHRQAPAGLVTASVRVADSVDATSAEDLVARARAADPLPAA